MAHGNVADAGVYVPGQMYDRRNESRFLPTRGQPQSFCFGQDKRLDRAFRLKIHGQLRADETKCIHVRNLASKFARRH